MNDSGAAGQPDGDGPAYRLVLILLEAAPSPGLVALLQSFLGITVLAVASIVAIGQFFLFRQRGWRESAEARLAIIKDLQMELDETKRDLAESRQELIQSLDVAARERETLEVRMEALEAQVADVQRQNYRLNRQLDEVEGRRSLPPPPSP